MITVNIVRNKNQITAFEIAGHAKSGPYGYDLVCAGVSAVSFGTVNAIISLCEVDLHIDQADEGGYLYVKLPPSTSDKVKSNIQLLLEGMVVSLQTIEQSYSSFIQINDEAKR